MYNRSIEKVLRARLAKARKGVPKFTVVNEGERNEAIEAFPTDLMKVIVDLCIVPMGVGVSVSKYIAECEKILTAAGLKTHLHAYGTNIEGEWDDVMAAIKQCHETVHAKGAPRITTTIKLGTRTDKEQSMEDKVDSVIKKI